MSHFHSFAGENKQPFPLGNYANRKIKGINVPDERSWISEASRAEGRITFSQMYYNFLGQRAPHTETRWILMASRDIDLINIDGPIWAPDFSFP